MLALVGLVYACSPQADVSVERVAPVVAPDAGPEVFVDPNGTFQLEIGPEWGSVPDDVVNQTGVPDATAWLVGEVANGFGPNVNVFSEPARGLNVHSYLDLSEASLPSLIDDYELQSRDVITLHHGGRGGRLVYSGRFGTTDLKFMAMIVVSHDVAIVATLTTPPSEFDVLRAEVEPYLQTLERTP